MAVESLILGFFLVIVTLSLLGRLRLWPIELLLGIVYIAMSPGLWNGRRWAWGLCLVVNLLSILDDIAQPILMGTSLGGFVEGLIIDILIVYYLATPGARSFFFPKTHILLSSS